MIALGAVADDQLPIDVGHLEAVDHHQRADGHFDARSAQPQHLREMRIAESQPSVDFVVGLVERAAGDEDANHGRRLLSRRR
jgi:hypothetical protein